MQDFHIHIPYDVLEEHLSFIKKHKFNLEIYFSSKSLDSSNKKNICKMRKRLGYYPSLSIHAPFMDLSPGAVDPKVREITVERFDYILDIAECLDVKTVVFHSGYEKWKYGLNMNLWLENSLLTWDKLSTKAAGIGVKIAIENIFEDEPSSLMALMKKMSSSHFGLCFDTGHLNLFSKMPLDEWIRALKPYILEFHLHDNNKTADQHLPIGDGTFDFKTLFESIKGQDIIYTLEAHTAEHVMKSIERLKQYL
ncbi:MAG: sugar phosphate isomerase/epimerase [Nitrospiraceae bacterium]|nr:sugar phosphate isomerase/epimerase [Nitrospiraceae bacterium]